MSLPRMAIPVLAALLMLGSVQALAQATPDLVRALRSADWQERHRALQRINRAYPQSFPADLREAVVELLASEARGGDTIPGEGHGEYVIDLVVASTRTGDSRVVRDLIALGGLGISRGIATFVASHGPGVLDVLDSLAQRAPKPEAAYVLVDLISEYGGLLTSRDSARALLSLLRLASSPSSVFRFEFAASAADSRIADLYPSVQLLASSDPDLLQDGEPWVRIEASRAAERLAPLWSARPLAEALKQAGSVLDELCRGASGDVYGQCTAARAQLNTAVRHVEAGQTRPALAALQSARRSLAALASRGVDPRLIATMVVWIRAVEERLL